MKEPYLTEQAKTLNEYESSPVKEYEDVDTTIETQTQEEIKIWYNWFKQGKFYLFGCAYMLVRVGVNVTMSIQPFYLISVTVFEKTEVNPTPIELALIPLLS